MENYLNKLKVAVINQNLTELEQIAKKEPVFETIEEAREIQAYLKEAVKIFEKEKNKLANEMQKIRRLQKYNLQNKNDSFNFKV